MITTYFKNMVMDNLFHTTAVTLPAKYYLAWSPTAVTDNGAGFTENAASTGYARVEMTGLNAAVDGVISNSTRLEFNESTAYQGISLVNGVYDAPTGGNLLLYDDIPVEKRKTIDEGTTYYVKPNEVNFTLKGL